MFPSFCPSSTAPYLAPLLLGSLLWASPARAEWSTTHTMDLVLEVEAGQGTAQARGASYAVGGSGLTGHPVLNSGAAPAAGFNLEPLHGGTPFVFTMSVTPADTVTPVDLSGGLPGYGQVSIQMPGSAGNLTGSIAGPSQGSAQGGGPGSRATLTQTTTVYPAGRESLRAISSGRDAPSEDSGPLSVVRSLTAF